MPTSLPNFTTIPNAFLGQPFGNKRTGTKPQPGLLAELGHAETKVYLIVLRATAGYHRREARISVRTMARLAGIDPKNVQSAAYALEEKGLVSFPATGGVTIWRIPYEDDGLDAEMGDEESVGATPTLLPQSVGATPTPSNKEIVKDNPPSSPKKPGDSAGYEQKGFKPIQIDVEEFYERNLPLKRYAEQDLRFDCPFCGDKKRITFRDRIAPCCSSPIRWKNNKYIQKELDREKTAAVIERRNQARAAELAANPAYAYLLTQATDLTELRPEWKQAIDRFIDRNGLAAFKDCLDFVIKDRAMKNKYGAGAGIVKHLIHMLPEWGNGQSHAAKGNAKAGRIYKLDEDGEIVFKSGEGMWDPIVWRDSEYAIGEAIVVAGVTYIKSAEKVYDRQETV